MSHLRALLLTDIVDSTELTARSAMRAANCGPLTTAPPATCCPLARPRDRQDRRLPAAVRRRPPTRSLRPGLPPGAGGARRAAAARAGMHVGPVTLRENSAADVARGAKPLEVEGVAKPAAARDGSGTRRTDAAHAEAAAALGDRRRRVQAHGHWRLKGLAEPVELFEAGAAGHALRSAGDGAKVYRVARGAALAAGARDREQPAAAGDVLRRPRARAGRAGAAASQARLLTLTAPAASARRAWRLQVRPTSLERVSRRRVAGRARAARRPGWCRRRWRRCWGEGGAGQAVADAAEHLKRAAGCCWCSTTASTCSTPARSWPRRCCGPARTCKILATSREALGIGGREGVPRAVAALPDRDRTRTRRSRSRSARRCGSSSSAPAACARTSASPTRTRRRSLASAAGSTAFRWPSSWRRRACASLSVEEIAAPARRALPAAHRRLRTAPAAPADAALADRLELRPAQEPERPLLQRLSVFAGGLDLERGERRSAPARRETQATCSTC